MKKLKFILQYILSVLFFPTSILVTVIGYAIESLYTVFAGIALFFYAAYLFEVAESNAKKSK